MPAPALHDLHLPLAAVPKRLRMAMGTVSMGDYLPGAHSTIENDPTAACAQNLTRCAPGRELGAPAMRPGTRRRPAPSHLGHMLMLESPSGTCDRKQHAFDAPQFRGGGGVDPPYCSFMRIGVCVTGCSGFGQPGLPRSRRRRRGGAATFTRGGAWGASRQVARNKFGGRLACLEVPSWGMPRA